MIYNFYADFDPDDKSIPEECVELTENSLCWTHDIDVPSGSFYRYSSAREWEFSPKSAVFSLCCSGDYLEVVESGTPLKRIVYKII